MKWLIKDRVSQEKRQIKPPDGADATVWEWTLVSQDGSQERPVQVWVTGTAMSSAGVHFRVDNARRTGGKDEIGRILEWDEPPQKISFNSDSEAPTFEGGKPGPEVRELTSLVEWFDERGIGVIFTGHGVGNDPEGRVEITNWTANLYDMKKDKLIGRSGGISRLDAVRVARKEFEQDVDAPPAAAEASAPAPRIEIEDKQRQRLRQLHVRLVWSAPSEDDPESGWMVEAYGEEGDLLDIAVQKTADDAFLTIYKSVVPQED